MAPVSLLDAIIHTRAGRASACRSSTSAPILATPFESTPRSLTSTPLAVAVSMTLACSVATTIRRSTAPEANVPIIARLLASVPPDVNTTSSGTAAAKDATLARASSTRRRATLPARWTEDGLPPPASASMAATMASRASGRSGAVAL